MPDPTLFTLAQAVLAAVETGYADNPNGLPERRYVADGQVAWDFDALGPIILWGSQVTVRILRLFPHRGDIAGEVPGAFGIVTSLGIQVEVQLLRCAPTVSADGEFITIPSTEEIEGSAEVILADAMDVWAALLAAYRAGTLPGCGGVMFMGWDGVGPEGGLAGGTSTFRLDLAG